MTGTHHDEQNGRRLFLNHCCSRSGSRWLASLRAQAERPAGAAGGRRARIYQHVRRQDSKRLEGDPKYWSVSSGAMTGEITPPRHQEQQFIIWKGAPADFELKVDYASPPPAIAVSIIEAWWSDKVTPDNKFAMRGYQCDIDGQNGIPGTITRRRTLFLGVRGQLTRVTGTQTRSFFRPWRQQGMGSLVTSDWNSVHLIARGNILMHHVNGRLMSMVIDDDAAGRTLKGLVGVQVHVGAP